MQKLPFGELPPYKCREFLPERTDLGRWEEIVPLFDRLDSELPLCQTGEALQRWVLKWSELSAALEEESAKRYIAMTCQTEDADAERAYLDFIEKIEPQTKPRQFRLASHFVAHPALKELPTDKYQVFIRDTRVQVELFRPENVRLETEEAKLAQQYQKLTGSLTVQFKGQEQTLIQMGRYLEEPDRDTRQEAWELVANRRLRERESFEDIFDQLLALRQKIAHNAGFADYRDYAFRRLGRFDYRPENCVEFHRGVEAEVVPVLRELQADRQRQLKLATLRPWDTAVDPLSRPPLRPFKEVEELVKKTETIFKRLDSSLGGDFERLDQLGLLDLANRKGKAPGGYQSTLSEARVPFIFMNAVGVQRDVETLLHEAGHAFHALACREQEPHAYRNPPIEFCEVASMSMELLGNQFLEEFYSSPDARRARRVHLEGVISVLAWIATVDAFQHWIYTRPTHSREERRAEWTGLMGRFGGDVDWSGYDEALGFLWHRQLHIFTHPFYYIEYGIAQLGALQVWANSRRDRAGALRAYKAGLSLGGARPLPELFAAAGCRFEFSQSAIRPLLALVRAELRQLAEA